MQKVISIGKQNFVSLRENDCFYIDKTDLICKWWESKDEITLITRPRRFGKTLNMSMLNCFFSNQFTGREDLFKGLVVWKKEKYRKMQGTYPVIFLNFSAIKGSNYEDARDGIIMAINEAYSEHRYLLESNELTDGERKCFEELDYYAKNPGIKKQVANDTICNAVKNLANCLSRYYKKKVIILLDEYDTPMQEAYLYGYWKEFTAFIRSLFNATFKTNPYLERAMMTGITRVSKESVFSDLNNLNVVTTTSTEYETCFGFSEEEVFQALEERGMNNQKKLVKSWYDGFVFGNTHDIYNPWSITNFFFKNNGFLNLILNFFYLPEKDWLHTSSAFWIICILYFWKFVGYYIFIYSSRLQMIPKEYYEYASLHGAGKWQSFYYITCPILFPVILFTLILSIMNAFKCYREAFLLGGTHPDNSIYFLQHFMNNNLQNLNYQKVSASATIITVFILFLSGLIYMIYYFLKRRTADA